MTGRRGRARPTPETSERDGDPMRLALKIVLPALAIALAGPAAAQTSDAPATTGQTAPSAVGDLALGEPVTGETGIGEPYIGAEFTDWVLRCVRTESGNDPCQLYQLLSDQEGNSVAEISVFPLPAGQQAEAGVTIITPLETLLTEQVTMRIDQAQAKRYPFTFCAAVGCVARIGLVPDEVSAFRRGTRAQVRIVPAAAPDQEVMLTVSLAGFTAGFQALVDGVAATQEGAAD
jgi:invasion protein IalB